MSGSDNDLQRTPAIACTLNADNLQSQQQRWVELGRRAGIDRAVTADGLTLTFRADQGVERELHELVRTENKCCSWAEWEVRADGGDRLVMHARSTGDGVAVLQSMF
jgi:hypothetical protein